MVDWFVSSFLSATLQVLLQKLADLGIKACESASDYDDKLETLKRTFFKVQSLIHVAVDTQMDDLAWQPLLQQFENVSYRVDDLFDEFAIEVSKSESGSHKKKLMLSQWLLFFSEGKQKMTSIQAELDDMLREIHSLLVPIGHLEKKFSKLHTSSIMDESHPVFGRVADRKTIIDMLEAPHESSRADNVSVISIVGMIGVGKTTLAQLVYKHYREREASFDLHMWVSANKRFDAVRLTRCIIEAASGESTSQFLNFETLQGKLLEIVRGKKFLIVFDDMWIEEQREWDILLTPLKQGLRGSKIIITTGSNVVSKLVRTNEKSQYSLECLSDQDCWSLLKEEALRGLEFDGAGNLDITGLKLATKCNGLPLAAKILGRLLRSEVNPSAWNDILEKNIWHIPIIKQDTVSALKMGYGRLPLRVRQCFAYCSMFPQSYQFELDKVVRMWMGEGLILPDKEKKDPEDIGSGYIIKLLENLFLQRTGENYTIHNAVHELVQSVYGEKFLRVEKTDDSRINDDTRHLSLLCGKIQMTSEISCKCKGLRTFLLLFPIQDIPLTLFELGNLRVLDMSGTRIKQLSESVGNLKHLHFLDLSNTVLKLLPKTIEDLYVLQTLILVNCVELLCLPKNTSRLKSLRHLKLGENRRLSSMPLGIGKLTGLLTLNIFIVGRESGQLKELKDMNNIRGSLRIKQLENVTNLQEDLEASLANKKYLEKLELQWSYIVEARKAEHVLDKLMNEPHGSLKELSLEKYGGNMFPRWVSDPLFSQVTSIYLHDCANCGLLPPLGRLPKLKSLKIDGMDELVMVDEMFVGDKAGFPSLEILEFRDMPKLERWVGVCDKDIVSLREFTIAECPQLVILPSLHHLKSLEKVKLEDCPKLPLLSEERLSSSVVSLIITGCDILEERCRRDGDDWAKTEHIRSRVIGREVFNIRYQ
ncbi:hypothetical protein ACHQM5_013105 [Ranunculus cassubicifolius]